MPLPATYLHWQSSAHRLMEPLAALMQPGHASMVIAGPASDHDAQADRLEGFARPLLLAAHYLQTVPEDSSSVVGGPVPVPALAAAPATESPAAFRPRIERHRPRRIRPVECRLGLRRHLETHAPQARPLGNLPRVPPRAPLDSFS